MQSTGFTAVCKHCNDVERLLKISARNCDTSQVYEQMTIAFQLMDLQVPPEAITEYKEVRGQHFDDALLGYEDNLPLLSSHPLQDVLSMSSYVHSCIRLGLGIMMILHK